MNQPETANDFAELLESAQYSHQVSVEAFRWIAAELRRLAELERDAVRYRWLRDTSNPDDASHPIALHINECCKDTTLSGIDAAIDAAMGEAK